jgi:putative dimethyl sulfoxide reductase chaperone
VTEQTAITGYARAASYKALAECYYPPDEALLKTLGDLEGEVAELLSEVIRSAPGTDDLDRHKVDHSKLFVGPFKLIAAPYGSVYLEDGKFMGESTLAAKQLYQQAGLDIVLKEAPDHISVELEFMYFLALKELEAIERSDIKQAALLRDGQASFLHTFLGSWVQPFAHTVEDNAQTDFYRALGRVTNDFVLNDLGHLQ